MTALDGIGRVFEEAAASMKSDVKDALARLETAYALALEARDDDALAGRCCPASEVAGRLTPVVHRYPRCRRGRTISG